MKTLTLVLAAGSLLAASSVATAGPSFTHNKAKSKDRPVMLSGVTDNPFSDNFDSYQAGTGIAGQGSWLLWDPISTDATVVNNVSSSAPNSLRLDAASDVVQVLDVTSGKWRISMDTYIPLNNNFGIGYFIGLNTFAIPSGPYNWSLQIQFNAATGMVRNVDDVLGLSEPIVYDTWVPLVVEVDLDNDRHNVWYNNVQITTDRSWTDGASGLGTLRIQCWDFYSQSLNDFYYDNIVFEEVGSGCYPNCDGSTIPPILNVDDFTCFINSFAVAQGLPHAQQITDYANCDGSTIAPVLNVDDFTCFINAFATGCP